MSPFDNDVGKLMMLLRVGVSGTQRVMQPQPHVMCEWPHLSKVVASHLSLNSDDDAATIQRFITLWQMQTCVPQPCRMATHYDDDDSGTDVDDEQSLIARLTHQGIYRVQAAVSRMTRNLPPIIKAYPDAQMIMQLATDHTTDIIVHTAEWVAAQVNTLSDDVFTSKYVYGRDADELSMEDKRQHVINGIIGRLADTAMYGAAVFLTGCPHACALVMDYMNNILAWARNPDAVLEQFTNDVCASFSAAHTILSACRRMSSPIIAGFMLGACVHAGFVIADATIYAVARIVRSALEKK